MAEDGTIKIKAKLDSTEAQNAMSKFSGVATKAMQGVTIAIGAASAAMTAMAGYSIKVGADFEAGMSKVSAISGATGDDIEALTEKAKEMGAKTKFSATEAASAFEYMAMAGWKTEDMLSGIEGVMNLAAASGEDLATTSDIVTDALTAFGLSASDSGHFADILAAASSNANTNVSMMGETFKYVAPVAGSLGYSAEDCATAIGLMANAGIKGSQAGTSLRAILSRMVKPTEEVQGAMNSLGISLTDSSGNVKSLDALMGDLRESFSRLSEAEKAQMASSIGGQEAMSGLLAIVNASDGDFNKLKDSIYGCDGAAESMAETMQDNLQGSVTVLGSALEGFGIKIYEKMQTPLKEAADTGTECINRLSDAFDNGGLHGVVEEAGEIFNDLADRIADTSEAADGVVTPLKNVANMAMDLGKSAAPVAVKTMEKLAENLDKVVPVAASAYTAFKVYASVTKSLTAAQKAHAVATELLNKLEKKNALQLVATNGGLTIRQTLMAVHNGQITVTTALTGLWTKAQTKLNAVMAANPIGLVVTAVAALAAGIGVAVAMSDKQTESTANLSKKQKELCEQIDETSDKVKQMKEAREESIESATTEIEVTDTLWKELQTIVDQNGKVKEGYEARAEYITGQLSSALGTEVELVDGVIQKYQEQVDKINELIEVKKAQAVLESMESDYQEAVKGKTDALLEYIQAQKECAEADVELEDARRRLIDIEGQAKKEAELYGDALHATKEKEKEAKEEVEALSNKYEELSGKEKEAGDNYKFFADTIRNYEGLSQAISEGDVQKIKETLSEITSGFKEFGQATDTELKQQAITMSGNMALIGDAVKSGIVSATDTSVTETANLTAKALGELSKLPEGAAGVASEINPSMLGALVGLSDSLSEESKKAVAGFIEGLNSEKVDKKTRKTFEDAVKGAIKGSEFGDQVSSKAKEMGISYLDALREVLEVHSPSRAVKEIFAQVMPGASEGLDEGKDEVLGKAGSFAEEFLGKFSESGLKEKLKELGSNAMSFFGIGVSSQTKNSKSAGQANADAANSGAGSVNPIGTGVLFGSRYASGVGSKAGEVNAKGKILADNAESGVNTGDGYTPGSDFGAGFVRGIGAWLGDAAKAAANLAMSAWNALRKALEEHSPSRKTNRSGKNFDLGLAGGIDENADYAISAASNLSDDTLEALGMDRIGISLGDIDIPETMDRINAAIDDKHFQITERVIAATVAKDKSDYLVQSENKIPLIDYKRLGRELSRRPIYVSTELNGRELIKETAVPMEEKLKENSSLKNMLNGVRL